MLSVVTSIFITTDVKIQIDTKTRGSNPCLHKAGFEKQRTARRQGLDVRTCMKDSRIRKSSGEITGRIKESSQRHFLKKKGQPEVFLSPMNRLKPFHTSPSSNPPPLLTHPRLSPLKNHREKYIQRQRLAIPFGAKMDYFRFRPASPKFPGKVLGSSPRSPDQSFYL